MLRVNENCEFRLRSFDPLARIFDTTGILRYGDNLEVSAFEFAIELLPPGQIKAASSPRGPRQEEHFLSTKRAE